MSRDNRFKYFAISERDKRWGLYIVNCGETHVAARADFPPPGHPRHHAFQWQNGRILHEYQLYYLLRGAGVFESDTAGRQTIRAGEMVLLFPGDWHRYKPLPNEEWHTYWAGFAGAWADHLETEGYLDRRQPVLRIGYQEDIVRSFSQLLDAGDTELGGYQQIMAGLLLHILGSAGAAQHRQHFQQGNQEAMIQRARVLLADAVAEPIHLEAIAAQLGLGYSFFRQLFKRYTGLAPGQYLIQLRLEKAKTLLRDPDKPIKQISAETGFETVHYFSRLFKEKTGKTPSQFRSESVGK